MTIREPSRAWSSRKGQIYTFYAVFGQAREIWTEEGLARAAPSPPMVYRTISLMSSEHFNVVDRENQGWGDGDSRPSLGNQLHKPRVGTRWRKGSAGENAARLDRSLNVSKLKCNVLHNSLSGSVSGRTKGEMYE